MAFKLMEKSIVFNAFDHIKKSRTGVLKRMKDTDKTPLLF